MDMTDALRLITTRAPSVAAEAMKTLRVAGASRQARYNWVVEQALRDPEANWTLEERAALVALVTSDDDTRTRMFPMRFTESEYALARERAERETGGNLAELIRRLLFPA